VEKEVRNDLSAFGGLIKKTFDVIIERDEDGLYVASVPSLKGCHTQAKFLDTLMGRIKEAIELCLEVQEKPVSCGKELHRCLNLYR